MTKNPSATPAPEHIRHPEKLNYTQVSYFISASTLTQCPPESTREVAFVGRSNAGKSSAINALTAQQSLARTSKTPGRTQLLNFFRLDDTRFLVDLPGFGYAKVPPKLKAKWQQELERYLQRRNTLKGLVLLMDVRHPLKEFDLQMVQWAAKANMPLHILLTKADKLKRGAAKTALLTVSKALKAEENVSIQLFSSLKNDGVRDLRRKLDEWMEEPEEKNARLSKGNQGQEEETEEK